MKIIVDIMHIPHINFLKNAIKILYEQGNEISVVCLDRGKNLSIANEEFKNIKVVPIGKHRGTMLSILLEANFIRFFSLFRFLANNRFDAGLSVGSFLMGFSLKFFNKPNLQFYDDPENRKNLFFQKITATKLYYPFFYRSNGIENFNALKEWAYLSPNYFNPDITCLEEYKLDKKEYIFIREVNSNTTNYIGQSSDMILTIASKFSSKIKVVLSLENKDLIKKYPKSWIVLNEPVKSIHSLMFYSKVILSSGDSMAREGAMLGVPSIYCGVRNMAANNIMEEKGLLFHLNIEKVPSFINKIFLNKKQYIDQIEFRKNLVEEWDDVTELIVKNILNLKT